MEIFSSVRRISNGKFGEPQSFSTSINTPYYEGTPAFNKDFTEMYFTRCGDNSEETAFCNIYYSEFDGSSWSQPELVVLFEDTVNVGHPTLSRDGKTPSILIECRWFRRQGHFL